MARNPSDAASDSSQIVVIAVMLLVIVLTVTWLQVKMPRNRNIPDRREGLVRVRTPRRVKFQDSQDSSKYALKSESATITNFIK